MMFAPTFAPSYPAPQYVMPPSPQFMPPPGYGRATPPAPAPAPWNQGYAQQAPARPIIRAQAPDEAPAFAPLTPPAEQRIALNMPSPEALGIATAQQALPASVDWAAVHSQLDRLGATCFHLERLQDGCRLTCLLPTRESGRLHHIEAQAASEAEVVRLALAQAEQWIHSR